MAHSQFKILFIILFLSLKLSVSAIDYQVNTVEDENFNSMSSLGSSLKNINDVIILLQTDTTPYSEYDSKLVSLFDLVRNAEERIYLLEEIEMRKSLNHIDNQTLTLSNEKLDSIFLLKKSFISLNETVALLQINEASSIHKSTLEILLYLVHDAQKRMRQLGEIEMIKSLNNTKSPWHRRLLLSIGPILYVEDLSLVDKNSPAWQFFFKFLLYYTPGTFNYESLESNSHKRLLKDLHNFYQPILKTKN